MPRAADKTVLVVDDEPNVRDYLAQILRDVGFHVVTASDGGEALEMIRNDDEQWKTMVENIAYAADKLAAQGLTLLIEPVNTFDIPGFLLSTTQDALKIINDTLHVAVGLRPCFKALHVFLHLVIIHANLTG